MSGEATSRRRSPFGGRMRPEFRFTREGRVFVLMTLGVGLGAVNTGNNLLYLVLGLLLGMLLTQGVLSEIALRGVRIDRGRAPRLFAGTPALFELLATNEKRFFASTSVEIGDVAEGDADAMTAYVPRLASGETVHVVVERTPGRRGPLRGTHVRIRTRFPFGILEKSRLFRDETEWLVYPRLVPVDSTVGHDGRRGDAMPQAKAGSGEELLGLRPYRPGDGLRELHARKSASAGRPVAKERAAEVEEPLPVQVRRAFARDAAGDAAFEDEVSRAASRVVIASETGRGFVLSDERGVLAEGRDRAALDHALATLARLERHEAADGVQEPTRP